MIERGFGILKKQFHVLLLPTGYPLDIQSQLPAALCAIHNFIQIHNKDKHDLEGFVDDKLYLQDHDLPTVWNSHMENTHDEVRIMRDNIATAMWNQYQTILSSQADVDMDDISSDTDETVHLW